MSHRSGKRPTSLFRQIYEVPYNDSHKIQLYNSAKGSLNMVQRLCILRKLPIHNGCVNCICWSPNGEYLLSGSDDHHLVVTNTLKDFKTEVRYQTNHRANIFNAKFLPERSYTSVISCSGDGLITFSDLNVPIPPSYLTSDTNSFSCHTGTVYELATIPHDPNTFLSAGEDYTVRCFDLRVKSKCHKMLCEDDILIQCQRAVTAISINEMAPYQMAIGTSDSTVRIFDRRMLGTVSAGYVPRNTRPIVVFTAPGLDARPYRITSVAFSPDGRDVLASYSSEYLYLFNLGQTASRPVECSQGWTEEGGEGSDVRGEDDVKACPVRRLRLRGDWSDTGPDARPESEAVRDGEASQVRPNVHTTVMQRMTDLLTRILNDPMTRAAIAGGDRDVEQHAGISEDPEASSSHQPPFDLPYGPLEPEPRGAPDNSMDIEPPPVPSVSNPTSSIHTCVQSHSSCEKCGLVLSTNEIHEVSSSSQTSSGLVCPRCTEQTPEGVPIAERSTSVPSKSDTHSEPIESDVPMVPSQPVPFAVPSGVPSKSDTQSEPIESDVPMVPSQPVHFAEPSGVPSKSDSHSEPIESDVPMVPSQPVPSTSGSGGDNSQTGGTSIPGLVAFKEQIIDMRHGFVKKHGKEPVVSLHVNSTGTMASSISFKPETSATGGPMEPAFTPSMNLPAEMNSPLPSTSSASQHDQHIGTSSSTSADYNMDIDQSSEDETNEPLTTRMEEDLMAAEESLDSAQSKSTSAAGKKRRGSGFCDEAARRGSMRRKFTGHRNARTMIKQARFWGDGYVMSGSDCGHVFIWDRYSGKLAMCLEADKHVVNCVLPHPTLPLLATSGIDYDVKIWEPRLEESGFDVAKAEELIKRNEIMLEETKDTITVPASFMIRMLACLNQIRRGSGLNRGPPGRRNPSESAE
ncbi:hypothetical protein M8J77_020819 [Diaphorina citri]|nr:hypothetical protein M8J77_020819 [Diaphorina citri]